jgi:hypothetical protein
MLDGKGIFDVVEVPPEALAILGGNWGPECEFFSEPLRAAVHG